MSEALTEFARICALIPAYNEADRIAATVGAIRSRGMIEQIVVIDDGSTDGTAERARAAGVDRLFVQENRGKGAALTRGFREMKDAADVFLLLDADLGASAAECVKLLPPLIDGTADMTVGALPPDPDFARSGRRGGLGFVVRLARWAIHRRTGRTFRQPLSGQRAVRRAALEAVGGRFADGFGVEVALTIGVLRAGFQVQEVETEFRHHVTGSDWRGILHRARQFAHVARAAFRA